MSNPLDKYDIRNLTEKKTQSRNTISVGITWVDGRIVFFRSKSFDKQGKFFYGICHFSEKIWAITPFDYKEPTMINTILVSPTENYCERAYSCINLGCPMNKFNRSVFESDYSGCGDFAKDFPTVMNEKVMWFNEGKWGDNFWKRLIIKTRFDKDGNGVSGGILKFDESKAKEL
jgi:hypothetical protein